MRIKTTENLEKKLAFRKARRATERFSSFSLQEKIDSCATTLRNAGFNNENYPELHDIVQKAAKAGLDIGCDIKKSFKQARRNAFSMFKVPLFLSLSEKITNTHYQSKMLKIAHEMVNVLYDQALIEKSPGLVLKWVKIARHRAKMGNYNNAVYSAYEMANRYANIAGIDLKGTLFLELRKAHEKAKIMRGQRNIDLLRAYSAKILVDRNSSPERYDAYYQSAKLMAKDIKTSMFRPMKKPKVQEEKPEQKPVSAPGTTSSYAAERS